MTRLGKHINAVRRQVADTNRSLAKRMKKLVKIWQQLLQNRPSNGLPPSSTSSLAPPRSSTPTNLSRSVSPLVPPVSHSVSPVSPAAREELTASPIKHDPSVLTISSSLPQTVSNLFPKTENNPSDSSGVGTSSKSGSSSDPARNRIKLLNLLSKVKKPPSQSQPQPTSGLSGSSQEPLTVSNPVPDKATRSVSPKPETSDVGETTQAFGFFSNKNFVPVLEVNGSSAPEDKGFQSVTRPSDPLTSHPIDSGGGNLPSPFLSLPVSLPLDSKKKPSRRPRKTEHKYQKKTKRLKHNKLQTEPLIVSFPRNLVKLKSNFSISNSNATDINRTPPTFTTGIIKPEPVAKDALDRTVDNFIVSIPTGCLQHKQTRKVLKAKKHSKRKQMNETCFGDFSLMSTEHAQNVQVKTPLLGKVLTKRESSSEIKPIESMDTEESILNGLSFIDSPSRLSGACVSGEGGAVPGVSGVEGEGGRMYSWTDAIPGANGTTVTVLPYVFIDDLTEFDEFL